MLCKQASILIMQNHWFFSEKKSCHVNKLNMEGDNGEDDASYSKSVHFFMSTVSSSRIANNYRFLIPMVMLCSFMCVVVVADYLYFLGKTITITL